MRLAIMQPYFLPYVGYFQLMSAVDKFVILDDVNYINRGWVNRNRLLLNGTAHMFTVPLRNASQNRLICDIELVDGQIWREKMIRTLRQAYGKTPSFPHIFGLFEQIINHPCLHLDEFLVNSLHKIATCLSLRVEIVNSSRIYGNTHLKGQERILDICRQEHAEIYINLIGGKDLYDAARFSEQGTRLSFLQPRPVNYPQGKGEFVPWLSILDVLMCNAPDTMSRLLLEYDLT